jgi:nucleoside-diphosphate-sugar epimerase
MQTDGAIANDSGTPAVSVTGGNGFLGKHVLSTVGRNIVRRLDDCSAMVFVVDLDRYDLRKLDNIRHTLADS